MRRGSTASRRPHRLEAYGTTLAYRRFADDFPYLPLNNFWDDTLTGGFVEPRYYVVQTNTKVIQRCVLMTTDAGDLVLDPTCGSGTTAYVAEQWGRRWITADVSRVPLALARQRLLTATFDWYELKDESRGPAGGFVYKRKQNKKGEELGGIVPHVTLKSIANNEPPAEEVLVDRPEARIARHARYRAVLRRGHDPHAHRLGRRQPADSVADRSGRTESAGYNDRMLEILRKSPAAAARRQQDRNA